MATERIWDEKAGKYVYVKKTSDKNTEVSTAKAASSSDGYSNSDWDEFLKKKYADAAIMDTGTANRNITGKSAVVQNNMYKLGGSGAIKNSGALPELGRYGQYGAINTRNMNAGREYLDMTDDEFKQLLELSKTDSEAAKMVYNIGKARTGGLSSIDTTGMSKGQVAELGRMGNLSARDDIYVALQKDAGDAQKPNIAGMFKNPEAYSAYIASGEDPVLNELLKERRTYDDYRNMYASYPEEALRKDIQNVWSYNTERNVNGTTQEEYEAARRRVYAATGKDYGAIAEQSDDIAWTREAMNAYKNGQQNTIENIFGDMSEAEYNANFEAYMNELNRAGMKGKKLDTWEEQSGSATRKQLNAIGSDIDYYRPQPMYLNIDPTYLEGYREYQYEDGTYMPAKEFRKNAVNEWVMAYVNAGEDEAKIAELDEARGDYLPEVEGYELDRLKYLTDDQKRALFIAHNNGDQETVDSLLETYRYGLDFQRASDMEKEWTEKYKNAGTTEKIGMNVQSIGQNVGTALEGVKQAVWSIVAPEELERISEYDPVYDKTRKANITRQMTGEEIAQKTEGTNIPWTDRNLWAAIYQGVMSGADSTTISVMLAPLGPAVQSIVMGGLTYANERMDKLQEGYSNEDANMDAWIKAAIEGASEYIPFDIMGRNSPYSMLKIASGTLAEGLGETASEIGQAVYDEAKYGQGRDKLRTEGYGFNGENLWLEWLKRQAPDVAEAAIGGFVAGGPSTAVSTISDSIQNRKLGDNLTRNEGEQALIDLAGTVPVSDQAKKIVERMKGEMAERTKGAKAETETTEDAGNITADDVEANEKAARERAEVADKKKGAKAVKNAEIGYVYREVMRNLDKGARQIVKDNFARDVRRELENAGYTGDSKAAAAAIADFANGDISESAIEIVYGSKTAHEIALSYVGKINERADMYKQAGELAQRADRDYTKPETTKAEKGAQEATQGIDDRTAVTAADVEIADVPESMVDGKAVTIEGVAEVSEDGSVTYNVTDAEGNTTQVSEAEVEIGQNDEAIATLSALARDLGKNAETMIRMYAGSQDVEQYAVEFRQAMQYGEDGRNLDVVKGYAELNNLNPEQITAAYEIGRGRRMQRNRTAVRKNAAGITVGKVDKSGINEEILDDNQRAAVYAMDRLANAAGFNIRFIESQVNAEAKYTTDNGSWDPKTLTLTLDVHAGSNSASDQKYAMMHTAGHELTHYIKQFADADLWNDYQEFVIGHLSKKDFDFESEIDFHMEKEGLDRDGAIEEIIADASGEALNNITEADIQSLAETNQGLLNKIKAFIKDWIGKLRARITEAYKGTEEKTEAGKQMMDVVDDMSRRWNALFVNAARNRAAGNVVSEATNVKYSLRKYSAQQKANWATSKKIVLYQDEKQAMQFVEDALKGKNLEKKMFFGMVPEALADRITKEAGYSRDITGYNVCIHAKEIRKTDKKHGNEYRESQRGQRAITVKDYVVIPETVEYADSIYMSPEKYMGLDVLMFERTVGGSKTTIVAVVGKGNLDLFVQTMYASAKKENLADAADAVAPAITSETTNGTVLDPIITQKNELGKAQARNLSRMSDREILADAMLTVAKNEAEKDVLERYRKRIADLNKRQQELEGYSARIRELREKGLTSGNSDELSTLLRKSREAKEFITKWDKQLLERETTSFMQTMLEHTKTKIAKESRAEGRKAAASRVSKARSKAKIVAEVSRLQKWITHPSNKEHVPEFLAKPIGDILKEFDYSGGMTLKTREIFESGDEAAILEWRNNVKARKDAAEKRYKEAVKEYEKAVNEGDENKIMDAEKKVNRTKGAYDSLADTYERGIESASQAFSRADSKFVRALQDMSDAISRIGRAQRGLEENAVEFSGWLDLTEATEIQFGNLVKKIRDTLEKTSAMKDTPVNRMTAEQLNALAEAMAQIRKAVVEANQLTQNVMFSRANTAAYDTIERAEKLGERKALNKTLAQVGDFLNWKNVTPVYVFERFGKAGKAMFSELQDGHDQLARNITHLKAYSDKAYTPEEISKWGKELHEFKLSSGKTVQMTTAQVMSLYCLNRRDQARGHLLGGGIRIENIEHKGKLITQAEDYTLFESDIEKIAGSLTKRQKEVADALQKFMSTVCADWGNVVSMKRFGYQMFTEGLYFPIESDTNNLRGIDEQARANDMFRLLNLSATKALTEGANNAIVVRNIFDVFAAHSSDMAKYNALAIPILDTLKWYNYVSKSRIKDKDGKEKQITTASVRKSIEMAYGKEAVNYITTFIKDLNGVHDGGRDDGFINKLSSNYKIASTGMNLRVMLLQMSSIPRAMYELDPKQLAKALVKSAVSIRRSAAAARENVGIAQWKALGFYDTNIASNVRDMIKHDTNFVDWFKEISTKGAAAMDSFTMGVIYNAVQMEMRTKHPTVQIGSATYNAMVNKRVREIVYKTQVVDSTMTRSQTMRDKGKLSAFTNFMSEPTLALSMILESVNQRMLEKRMGKEFAEKERGDDKRTPNAKMARSFMAFSASALTAALLESLFDAFRDDDEFESFAEKFQGTFGENILSNINPLEMIPIVNELFSAIQGYDNERMETSFIYNGVEALKKIYAYIKDPEGKEVYSVIYASLQALSQMTGLAVSNLVRDAISIYNTWIAEPLNRPRIQTRKDSEKTVATSMYKAAMSGDTAGFEKLMGRAELYGITAEDLENEYNNLVSNDYLAGNINSDEAKRVFKMYGGKTEYQAQTLVDKLDYEKETGRKYSKVESEYVSGAISKADAKKALTTYGDTTAEDADAKILTWDYEKATGRKYSAINNEYIRGELSRSEIKKAMVNYGGQSGGDAEKAILHLDYQKKTNRPWSKLMDDYIGGRFTKGQVKTYLMDYDLKDEYEALDTIDKYDWAKTHGGSTDGYSKYVTVHEAIDSGRGFDEAVEALVEKYTARGETRKDVLSSIRSSITSKYKPIYLAASASEQAAMREYLLDAYVALGGNYNTYYKNMTDKWFED